MGSATSSSQHVFGSRYDVILQGSIQLYEESAVAGHSDQQVPVLFGAFLGLTEGVGTYHIELYVHPLHGAHGPDQGYKVPNTFGVFKGTGMKFQIEQGPVGNDDMIHFGNRLDDRRRAFDIEAWCGRDAVSQRLPAPVAAGKSPHPSPQGNI